MKSSKKRKKEKYAGRGNSPCIIEGKGDTLAPKSRESLPPTSFKSEVLMGVWRVSGSTRLQNLAVRSAFFLNSTPSGNKFVGIFNRMGMQLRSRIG
eukprot:1161899-Pelagomonas_calceolata.AAC.4